MGRESNDRHTWCQCTPHFLKLAAAVVLVVVWKVQPHSWHIDVYIVPIESRMSNNVQ